MSMQAATPGLCSVTFRGLNADSLIALAADHGVRAIEWGGDVHVPPGDIDTATKVARSCARAAIACPSYGSYVRAGTEGARAAFAGALQSAQALGASNVRVWAGTEAGMSATAADWDRAVADLQAMSGLAADAGMTVSVEYHRNTLTETVADTETLLQRAQAAGLFTYWQPVPGRGLAAWQDEIRRLSPWLGFLHVFHWHPGADRDDRRPLAEGEADWRTLMADWRQAPGWPGGRVAFLEFVADDSPQAFAADMEVLHRLCAGATAA